MDINRNILYALVYGGGDLMIIKRIVCEVNENQQNAFYEEQKQWTPLSMVKGFLGQVGGWSEKHPLTAYIYSLWKSQTHYEYFMQHIHDEIFIYSGQKETCTSIKVRLFQEKLNIPGTEEDMGNVLRTGNYIRVALADVKEHKVPHFVEIQKRVWNTGMKKAGGMLGGTFACSPKESSHFLVLSGWKEERDHEKYMEEYFPELVEAAHPQNDVLNLTGEQFKVEEAWRVCPKVLLNEQIY
jgi:quinol monooxygenase YgiN